MEILVIDGQGGGLGRQLVAAVQQALPDARITAVGTNSQATAAMRKAGAHRTATGENAVVVAERSPRPWPWRWPKALPGGCCCR